MGENEIARQIFDAAFVVHTHLGPRLFDPFTKLFLPTNCERKV